MQRGLAKVTNPWCQVMYRLCPVQRSNTDAAPRGGQARHAGDAVPIREGVFGLRQRRDGMRTCAVVVVQGVALPTTHYTHYCFCTRIVL